MTSIVRMYGITIHLDTQREGLMLSLGADGLNMRLDEEAASGSRPAIDPLQDGQTAVSL